MGTEMERPPEISIGQIVVLRPGVKVRVISGWMKCGDTWIARGAWIALGGQWVEFTSKDLAQMEML